MPIGGLTEVERHRLQQFPPAVPEPDLVAAFILTEADRRLVPSPYGAGNRLGLALQLCALWYLEFTPEPLRPVVG